jgi:peptidylprolyl isomerase
MIIKAVLAAAAVLSFGAAASAQWRPSPVQGATEPAEVLKASKPGDWREIAAENLLVMDLAEGGRVLIELAPDFAPVHVANIAALARGGWWQGASIYRVQDNYVVQWGLNESDKPLPKGVVKQPPAEYQRAVSGLKVRPLGYPDSYAPLAGPRGRLAGRPGPAKRAGLAGPLLRCGRRRP